MNFDYVFLDDTFSKLYASESRFQKLFVSMVILGILIACLGLLGLATFSAQQRVKEIGVRKVLGASVPHVVGRKRAQRPGKQLPAMFPIKTP